MMQKCYRYIGSFLLKRTWRKEATKSEHPEELRKIKVKETHLEDTIIVTFGGT